MAEVLIIPELRDEIAKFGIPNYQFLRCLNQELHKIWNSMFYSSNMLGMLIERGDEYNRVMRNTRILKIKEKGFLDLWNDLTVFDALTYLKISNKVSLTSERYGVLRGLKKLQVINFSERYIKHYDKTNYKKINFRHWLNAGSQIEDLNFDESDLEMISISEQIIEYEDLLLINDGRSNFLELHTSDSGTPYFAKAKNICLFISYEELPDLLEEMKEWLVQNLTIKVAVCDLDPYLFAIIKYIFQQHHTLKSFKMIFI